MVHYPFHLIIKPVGDACNLDCTYCFYKEKSCSQQKIMDLDTLEKMTQRYIWDQPESCKEIQFVWQGGEPLLAGIEFFEQALLLQKKHQRNGIRVTNSIQTNGTLINKRWAEFFHHNQFSVGISIDGNQAHHDSSRIYSSGSPSYEQTLRGLNHLKAYRIPFNILCVVHDKNIDDANEIYQSLSSHKAQTIQYLPDMLSIPDSSRWGDFLIKTFEQWIHSGLGNTSVQLFDVFFTKIHTRLETFCVHAKSCGSQLAMEKNGDIYSCDHYVEEAHKLGNIHTMALSDALAHPSHQDFIEQSLQRSEKCDNCSVRGVCQGGCPKQRDARHTNELCDGYYRFFTHTAPYFFAMSECLKRNMPLTSYRQFLPITTGI